MKNIFSLNCLCFLLFLLLSNLSFGQVRLSFKNDSDEEFKILKVDLFKSTHIFKSLKPGESTLPIIINGSYPYCPLQIITATDTIRFMPIDYVGEKYYESGKLKMILNIVNVESKKYIKIKTNKK